MLDKYTYYNTKKQTQETIKNQYFYNELNIELN